MVVVSVVVVCMVVVSVVVVCMVVVSIVVVDMVVVSIVIPGGRFEMQSDVFSTCLYGYVRRLPGFEQRIYPGFKSEAVVDENICCGEIT